MPLQGLGHLDVRGVSVPTFVSIVAAASARGKTTSKKGKKGKNVRRVDLFSDSQEETLTPSGHARGAKVVQLTLQKLTTGG